MVQNSLLPLADFERIFQVAHSVLKMSGSQVTHRSCVFFVSIGSAILERDYGMVTQFYAGSFAMMVNANQRKAVAYGRLEDGDLVSDEKHFHAWVESGGWFIDFAAPLLGASAAASGCVWDDPTKMLQKRMAEGKRSFKEVRETGDFYFARNLSLTAHVIRSQGEDFARPWEAALRWYRRPPSPLPEQTLRPGQGSATTLVLQALALHDAW